MQKHIFKQPNQQNNLEYNKDSEGKGGKALLIMKSVSIRLLFFYILSSLRLYLVLYL